MPPRKKPAGYKFARYTTSVRERGSKYPTTVHAGTVWHADYQLVIDNPDLFSDEPAELLPRGWSPPVEQATAAPGEERDTGRAG